MAPEGEGKIRWGACWWGIGLVCLWQRRLRGGGHKSNISCDLDGGLLYSAIGITLRVDTVDICMVCVGIQDIKLIITLSRCGVGIAFLTVCKYVGSIG